MIKTKEYQIELNQEFINANAEKSEQLSFFKEKIPLLKWCSSLFYGITLIYLFFNLI